MLIQRAWFMFKGNECIQLQFQRHLKQLEEYTKSFLSHPTSWALQHESCSINHIDFLRFHLHFHSLLQQPLTCHILHPIYPFFFHATFFTALTPSSFGALIDRNAPSSSPNLAQREMTYLGKFDVDLHSNEPPKGILQ